MGLLMGVFLAPGTLNGMLTAQTGKSPNTDGGIVSHSVLFLYEEA